MESSNDYDLEGTGDQMGGVAAEMSEVIAGPSIAGGGAERKDTVLEEVGIFAASLWTCH